MDDARLAELQDKINGIVQEPDKTFYIMPPAYFAEKTGSSANLVMPPRLDGEGVFDYMKRAKKSIKRNDNLPSVITGTTVETLDITDLFLTPDFD